MTSLKKIKYSSLFCLSLIISCNDIQTTISNNPNLNLDYKLNLSSSNNGQNKDSVNIHWNEYSFNDFSKYQLSFDNTQIDITDSTINSYVISLNAGEFRYIDLSLYNDQNNIINQESIQIEQHVQKEQKKRITATVTFERETGTVVITMMKCKITNID